MGRRTISHGLICFVIQKIGNFQKRGDSRTKNEFNVVNAAMTTPITYYNDKGSDVVFRDEVPLPPSKKGPSDKTPPKPPLQGPPPNTEDLFAKAMDQALSEGKGWKEGEREVRGDKIS